MRMFLVVSMALILALGVVPSTAVHAAEEGDTGKWVTNSDGTLSIDSTAAENAVKDVQGQVSLVLIGTTGGKITLPTSSFGADVTYKISDEGDAALVLYKNKVDKATVASMLPNVKYDSSVTSVKISVTDGDTKGIDVSSTDTTFGIMGVDGAAHIYKFVQGDKSWVAAYHEAVSGDYVLGGFKGYLATVTTDAEINRLNKFYKSVTTATAGGWIAATSLRYAPDNTITSYDTVKDLKVTPNNHDTYSTYSKEHVGNVNKVSTNNGAYYWTDSNTNYLSYYYWACGPEMGQEVTGGYASGEPNNYNTPTLGECCTVASYNNNPTFNDYPINQSVAGYFLEFSVYDGGLENSSVTYKTTTIYRVSYDKNGASSGEVPNTQAKFLNQALTLATNSGELAKTGNVGFNGWNTAADGNGTHYDAGATYPADQNSSLTLYAEWVENPAKPPTVTASDGIELKYGYEDESGNISVTATAATDEVYDLTYQWYSNTENSNENGTIIEGAKATSNVYKIPAGLGVGDHYYYCIVTATKRNDTNKKAATASEPIKVTVGQAPAEISFNPNNITKTYGNESFNVSDNLQKTGDAVPTYSSTDESVVKVDPSSGLVEIVGVGEADIKATVADITNYTYDNKTATCHITISRANIDPKPTVSMDGYTYGASNLPQPSISTYPGDGAVKYYYNTSNSTSGGTEWTNSMNSKSLDKGTYYMYAEVAESANYNAVKTDTVSFEVTAADITATASDYSDVYDGNLHSISVDVTEPSSSSDTYTIKYGLSDGTYDKTENPTFTNVGTNTVYYEITSKNYVTKTGSATVTITPKAVTVSGIKANDKIYDKTYSADLNYDDVEFDGVVGNDKLNVTAAGQFVDVNVGTDKTVAISNLTLGGASKDNYKLADSGNQTETSADITPKEVGLTWKNTELVYNGSEQAPTATATGLVEGDSCTVTVTGGQTEAGENYTATASELSNPNYKLPTNKTTTFKIKPAPMDITASDFEGVYDGAEHGITVTVNSPSDTVIKYRESDSGEYDLNDNPSYTDVGEYTVYYQITKDNFETVEGSKTVKITNATLNDVTVTPEPLTYNGEEQVADVATTATAVNGQPVTFTYSTEEDGEYSSAVPAFTNAGDHTVYFKASAPNHDDYTGSFVVNIAKADANEVSVKMEDWTYGDDPKTPELKADFGEDTVVYTYSSSQDGAFGDIVPTEAGNWFVKASIAETSDYVGGEAVDGFTINKAEPSVTAPKAVSGLVYNEAAQELLTPGSAEGGTMYYAIGKDGGSAPEFDGTSDSADKKWSTSVPTGIDAGNYYVYYVVIGDKNHTDIAPECIPVTILEKLYKYYNVSGHGGVWYFGSKEGLDFVFKRTEDDEDTFEHFTGIKVDSEEKDASLYDAKEGSVIITLKPEYLETLAVGDHTLTAMFDDGENVTVSFEIIKTGEMSDADKKQDANKETSVTKKLTKAAKTGDNFMMLIWVLMLIDSFMGIIYIVLLKKKTR